MASSALQLLRNPNASVLTALGIGSRRNAAERGRVDTRRKKLRELERLTALPKRGENNANFEITSEKREST